MERQTERERNRESQRERDTHTHTQSAIEALRDRDIERQRDRERQSQRERKKRDGNRVKDRKRDKERERQRHKDRQRQTDRQTERDLWIHWSETFSHTKQGSDSRGRSRTIRGWGRSWSFDEVRLFQSPLWLTGLKAPANNNQSLLALGKDAMAPIFYSAGHCLEL